MSTQAPIHSDIGSQRPRSTGAAAAGIAVGLSAEKNKRLTTLMNKEGFKLA